MKKVSVFTITPNPALDLGGVLRTIVPDEKNYVQHETRFPGGNAINVARLLTRLSVPVSASGFLGGGVGDEIMFLLQQEKVSQKFIKIKGNTRINITLSCLSTHEQTRLSFAGPLVSKVEVQQLKKQVSKLAKRSILVVGGSFPLGFTVKDLNQILVLARKQELVIVLDIPGSLLKKVNLKGVALIKPNLTEFQEWVGKSVSQREEVIQASQKITQKVKWLCVSSVEGGALLISKDQHWFAKAPPIQIRSTVGAGDSMVAGMVAALSQKQGSRTLPESGENLLKMGLAAAAATLSTYGTTLGDPKEIKKLIQKIHVV